MSMYFAAGTLSTSSPAILSEQNGLLGIGGNHLVRAGKQQVLHILVLTKQRKVLSAQTNACTFQ